MENEPRKLSLESFPMNGGDGPFSYMKNSSMQRGGLEGAKAMIKEAIAEKLVMKQIFSPSLKSFNIADLGCSVGSNTFFAVQNIIESVKLKYQSHGYDLGSLEFQVFFNDHASNDFNMLFKLLPLDKQYYAAGVPGSFYGRLFPKASLHFVHSSYALQMLSKVPKELVDKHSSAWNKGRVYCTGAPNEVLEAYTSQFSKDIDSFLNARSLELVAGGLMAFLIPSVPPHSKCSVHEMFDHLGSTLTDMARMGLLSEDKVDSFNLPLYIPSPQELEALIGRNGYFSIERMDPISSTSVSHLNLESIILGIRATWEGFISAHFGSEIIDELFNQFKKKLAGPSNYSDSKPMIELLVVLRRKFD